LKGNVWSGRRTNGRTRPTSAFRANARGADLGKLPVAARIGGFPPMRAAI